MMINNQQYFNNIQKNDFKSPLLKQLAERLANIPVEPKRQPYAVLVVITNELNPKILYSLRASTLQNHAGEVSFAGGRQEPDDSSNHATALRETWEETGILPTDVQILGELPMAFTKAGLPVLPVVGVIESNLPLTPEIGEIERLFWADLATLLTQEVQPFVKQYDKIQLTSPAFIIDNEKVWGLTGRITASLLEIGFDRKIEWYYDFG